MCWGSWRRTGAVEHAGSLPGPRACEAGPAGRRASSCDTTSKLSIASLQAEDPAG